MTIKRQMTYCTRDRQRKSNDSAWPARRADGTKFYEPRKVVHEDR